MGVHTIKCVGARVRRRFIINMAVIKWVLKQISLKCLLLGTNYLVKETFEEIHDRKTGKIYRFLPVFVFSVFL